MMNSKFSEEEVLEINEKEMTLETVEKDEIAFDTISEDGEIFEFSDNDKFDAKEAKKFEKEIVDEFGNDLDESDSVCEVGSAIQEMLKSMKDYPMLEPEQERKLIKIAKTGKRECDRKTAKDRLALCNMRLVVFVAKKFRNLGVPFEDLIQEGFIGLMKGIERFDGKVKTRLSTYAVWWIRQAVARYISDQGRVIRLPVHVNDKLSKINKVKKQLTDKLGREPELKEIAKKMKMKVSELEELFNKCNQVVSLDKPIGDEEDMMLGDIIPDDKNITPETNMQRVSLHEKIEKVLSTLKEKERQVLILRFGLEDGVGMTLDQVGKIMNITRERVRQIESQALFRIKYRVPELEEYVA